MNNIRADIFIPTSNRVEPLKKCLDSLQDQTNKQFKVLLVALKPNENVKNLVNLYKNLDIDYFIQKDKGIIPAGNEALQKAKHEIFIRIDDDVILDYCSMNSSFDLAKQKNFPAFQISLATGSESSYPCTQNMPGVEYTDTNFIEVMCPVFRKDTLVKVMELINQYDIYTGWGLDYVLSEWINSYVNVIHDVKMFHPPRPDTGSGYDKTNAFREMHELLHVVFPKVMAKEGRKMRTDYERFNPEIRSSECHKIQWYAVYAIE